MSFLFGLFAAQAAAAAARRRRETEEQRVREIRLREALSRISTRNTETTTVSCPVLRFGTMCGEDGESCGSRQGQPNCPRSSYSVEG